MAFDETTKAIAFKRLYQCIEVMHFRGHFQHDTAIRKPAKIWLYGHEIGYLLYQCDGMRSLFKHLCTEDTNPWYICLKPNSRYILTADVNEDGTLYLQPREI